jgi:hypothetical protein
MAGKAKSIKAAPLLFRLVANNIVTSAMFREGEKRNIIQFAVKRRTLAFEK